MPVPATEESIAMTTPAGFVLSRRDLLKLGAGSVSTVALPAAMAEVPGSHEPARAPVMADVALTVNGQRHRLRLDTRVTLLDALREHLQLTGTKKGCDHGQCGACTVLVDGRRINACLALAVMHEGAEITTIEGLGSPQAMHPMQAAFVRHDGYQCGYCTPGQICSAVAMLQEVKDAVPSHVTDDLTVGVSLTGDEIRERMSGNLCRCGAYSNIVDAIEDVGGQRA